MEIAILVNEAEVGISNTYTGRYLAVQLSRRLAVQNVPTFTEKPVVFFVLVPPISSGFGE